MGEGWKGVYDREGVRRHTANEGNEWRRNAMLTSGGACVWTCAIVHRNKEATSKIANQQMNNDAANVPECMPVLQTEGSRRGRRDEGPRREPRRRGAYVITKELGLNAKKW